MLFSSDPERTVEHTCLLPDINTGRKCRFLSAESIISVLFCRKNAPQGGEAYEE
jgi:hypothetical protein